MLFGVFAFSTNNASANHSWGSYHWARTANPFTLKLGDNVSSTWDSHLIIASSDWTLSSVLDTTIVAGGLKRNCGPVKGRVEVCNSKYGNNGWLGIAQIWVNGSHIIQGVTKMNDTYFSKAPYNTASWKRLVVCQEVGHTFGLNHQDENFSNTNLGTCMDYTNDPNGTLANPDQLSNEHPNTHDYDQLGIIYSHFDSFTSALSSVFNKKSSASASTSNDSVGSDIDVSDTKEWGREIQKSKDGRSSLHERDFGKGNKVFTFVTWAQ
jgi:hypothetical protein